MKCLTGEGEASISSEEGCGRVGSVVSMGLRIESESEASGKESSSPLSIEKEEEEGWSLSAQ